MNGLIHHPVEDKAEPGGRPNWRGGALAARGLLRGLLKNVLTQPDVITQIPSSHRMLGGRMFVCKLTLCGPSLRGPCRRAFIHISQKLRKTFPH